LAPVVVRELPSRSGDNGRLREIIIKRLMDRVSESEWLRAYMHYLHAG